MTERIYVEKKPGFDIEAKRARQDFGTNLALDLDDVRIVLWKGRPRRTSNGRFPMCFLSRRQTECIWRRYRWIRGTWSLP